MDSFLSIIYHAPFDDTQFKRLLEPTNVPLWGRWNLQLRNDDEYLDFEIKEKDSESGSEEEFKEAYTEIQTNTEKNQCHLCNIEVPSGCMRLHQKGEKHKVYVKISEVALERFRKQMMVVYPTEKDISHMYFCDSCVVLIPMKDKLSHMLTNHHKNSMFIDKLLNDFSKLYSDDDDVEEHTEVVPSKLPAEEYVQFNDINKGEKNQNVYKEEKIVNKELKPMLAALKECFEKSNLTNKFYYLDETNLILKTEDGIYIKVAHTNFHSFFVLDEKHVQCKLCCKIAGNMYEHMLDGDHLIKVSLPVDKNCIRQLEESKGHCILCNELVQNPEIHALCDTNHDNNMIQAMIFDKNIDNYENVSNKSKVDRIISEELESLAATDASKLYFCNVCYLSINKNDSHTHSIDPKHITNSKMKERYLFTYSGVLHTLDCLICNTSLPTDKIKEHLSNTKHSSAYNNLLAINCLKMSTGKIYCEICPEYIRIGDEIKHIQSSEHIELLKLKNLEDITTKTKKNKNKKDKKGKKIENKTLDKNTNMDNDNLDKGKLVTCKVCDVTMRDEEPEIKSHLLNYHQIDDTRSVIENSQLKLVGNSFICANCCEYVSIEDELKHLSNPTHIVKSFKKPQINVNTKKTFALAVKMDDKNNNVLPSTTKNNNEVPSTVKLPSKDIVPMPREKMQNSVNTVQLHENGNISNKNLQAIMKDHKIEDRIDYYRCTVCCIRLEKNELMDHINSEHQLTVEKNKSSVTTITYCDVCHKYITMKMETHVLSASHKSKEIPKNVASYLCQICDVELTNSSINKNEHNDGSQHKKNLKMLDKNTIKVFDDKCYCETCDMSFIFKLIKQHINTSQHLILMGN